MMCYGMTIYFTSGTALVNEYFNSLLGWGNPMTKLKAELGTATDLIEITVVGYSFFKW